MDRKPLVLFVDDDSALRNGVVDLLELSGYETITAEDGAQAMAELNARKPDIIVSDIMMPFMDGYEFYEAVRANSAWLNIPFIILSAKGEKKDLRQGTKLGVDSYLTKPFEPQDLIAALESRLKRTAEILRYERLRHLFDGTIHAMGMMVEVRDPYTAGHQKNVAELSAAISSALSLPEEEIKAIEMTSLVHDIGKISVPAEILTKPGKLMQFEFDLIKNHSQVGYEILKGIEFTQPVAEMVWQHHERLDGSGYPRGLSGEDILLGARIIGVADVVEAMTAHRPYRPAKTLEAAMQEIEKGAGQIYDSTVTKTCLSIIRDQGFQFSDARDESS